VNGGPAARAAAPRPEGSGPASGPRWSPTPSSRGERPNASSMGGMVWCHPAVGVSGPYPAPREVIVAAGRPAGGPAGTSAPKGRQAPIRRGRTGGTAVEAVLAGLARVRAVRAASPPLGVENDVAPGRAASRPARGPVRRGGDDRAHPRGGPGGWTPERDGNSVGVLGSTPSPTARGGLPAPPTPRRRAGGSAVYEEHTGQAGATPVVPVGCRGPSRRSRMVRRAHGRRGRGRGRRRACAPRLDVGDQAGRRPSRSSVPGEDGCQS
jgi:hypothetical protein